MNLSRDTTGVPVKRAAGVLEVDQMATRAAARPFDPDWRWSECRYCGANNMGALYLSDPRVLNLCCKVCYGYNGNMQTKEAE